MDLKDLENYELVEIIEALSERLASSIMNDCINGARITGLERAVENIEKEKSRFSADYSKSEVRSRNLELALDKALVSGQESYAQTYGEINTLKEQACGLESKVSHLEDENKMLVAELNKARMETLMSVENMVGDRVREGIKEENKVCYWIAKNINTSPYVAETAVAEVAARIKQRGSW
jgi:chromosome segregation ATPase